MPLFLGGGVHVDVGRHLERTRVAADAATGELDDPVCQGKQGVIRPFLHVVARAEFGPALAHQDVPGLGVFPRIHLDAQTLALGIATVTGGTTGFLMCHKV